jgi:hypothetical protein
MPRKDGRPTRKERSARNKAAYALARRELQDQRNDIAALLPDPYRDCPVPVGVLSAAELRKRRGERSDGDCIDEVCVLVACGITLTKARDFIGVPHWLWETWVRRDIERIVDKLKFARECNLELMADQIIDIADDAKEEDAVVAAMRIKVRQWHLERRDPRFAMRNFSEVRQRSEVSISQKLETTMSPEEAMRQYIKLIDAKPL